MTTNPPTIDAYASWDAAYVLGSLTPADRREYERHVAGCPSCRDRLAELSGLPGLLALVGRDTLDPAPGPLPSATPYAVFARKVRRWRTGLAAAAAAAVLVLGAGAAALTTSLLPPAAPTAAQTSTAAARPSVQLAFTSTGQHWLVAHGTASPEPWGTELSWTCSYAPGASVGPGYGNSGNSGNPGNSGNSGNAGNSGNTGNTPRSKVYELVAVTAAGGRVTLATWRAAPGSTVSPVATTTMAVGAMKALLIQEQGSTAAAVPLLRAQL
ncbi:hypothetical protein B5P43_29575 [Bacillus sp. SRB_336]|nr:hypothetical protein B5P43_29575 [Bacillus sp. SRB_336]